MGRLLGLGIHVVQVADAHGAAFDHFHSCSFDEVNHRGKTGVSVVVEVIDDAFLVSFRWSKIYDQHAAAGLQHPSDLSNTLVAQLAGEMMKHEGAQHHIELRFREWQCFNRGIPEIDVQSRLAPFFDRASEHLG